MISFCFDLKKDWTLLPARIQYIDDKINDIKNSRLGITRERIFETITMLISKLKLDLMNTNSIFFESIDEIATGYKIRFTFF